MHYKFAQYPQLSYISWYNGKAKGIGIREKKDMPFPEKDRNFWIWLSFVSRRNRILYACVIKRVLIGVSIVPHRFFISYVQFFSILFLFILNYIER